MRTREDAVRNRAMADTPGCHGEYDDNGDFECGYEEAPICEDCMYGPIGGKHINPKTGEEEGMSQDQEKRAREIQATADVVWNMEISTIKTIVHDVNDVFTNAPKGDFQWEGEAGDRHVYFCDDKDCPLRWHTNSYYEVIGRRKGKLFIELWECDSCGNHEVYADWVEDDDPKWILEEMLMILPSYFKGWLDYWLDCAYRVDDPLQMAVGRTINDYLEFAEDNLKYLKSR